MTGTIFLISTSSFKKITLIIFCFCCFICIYFSHWSFEATSFVVRKVFETIEGNRVVSDNYSSFKFYIILNQNTIVISNLLTKLFYFLLVFFIYFNLISFTVKPTHTSKFKDQTKVRGKRWNTSVVSTSFFSLWRSQTYLFNTFVLHSYATTAL